MASDGRRSGGRNRGGRGRGGQRELGVRVKTARRRSNSSARWLERQLNDPYVQAAKREGYRSRAAYKLLEIDDKYHLLKQGARVVDLGAAPGGWTQVAVERTGAGEGQGRVVGLDLLAMDTIPGAVLLEMDFMDDDAPARLREALGGPADIVLSDMAPSATGHKPTDHLRIVGLCEAAYWFALEVLAEGGSFCAKVWQGGAESELLAGMKRHFRTVRHVKPAASRKESAEMYVLATGFRGRPDA